jgi:hypothetical protein
MGGSSGPLWGAFVYGLGAEITHDSLKEALSRIKELGNAKVGDRTMVDVLEPLILNDYGVVDNLPQKA